MSTDTVSQRFLLAYIAIVAAFGATLAGLVTAATVTGPKPISWPLLAVAFAATEIGVVHLRLGRNSFSFTLHEAVLVGAAVLASPQDVMVGLLVGTTVVMAGVQRLSLEKVVFNVGQYLLGAAVVVAALGPLGVDVIETPRGWILTFATAALVTIATMLLIACAIRLAQGTSIRETVTKSVASSLTVTMVSTAIGLAVASVASDGVVRLALLVPIVVVIAFGVHSYHQLLHRSNQLELVHGTVRSMSHDLELEPALELLATRACATLTAERAVLILRGPRGVRQVVVSPDGISWGEPATAFIDAIESATRAGGGVATLDSASNLFGEVFSTTGVEGPAQALIAELAVGDRVHGAIAVVQARGVANAGREELELLRSLALHAALVLESTQMSDAHARLLERTAIDRRLGLPTLQTIDQVLERAETPTALVYVSLSGFEAINDVYGFDAGDEVLGAVAGRLKNLARPDDLVARVGGDEFAIFITGASDPFAIEAFGERIAQHLATPLNVHSIGETVSLTANVGVGFGLGGEDAATLIRSAHEHLRRRRARRHLGVDGF